MQPKIYTYTRLLLFPVIITANFFQNYFTKYFTPMNMVPFQLISLKIFKKLFYGKVIRIRFWLWSGLFSSLFDSKKYVGIDINKSFINLAKTKFINHKFYNFDQKKLLKKYKNKIDYILINNVIHHLEK